MQCTYCLRYSHSIDEQNMCTLTYNTLCYFSIIVFNRLNWLLFDLFRFISTLACFVLLICEFVIFISFLYFSLKKNIFSNSSTSTYFFISVSITSQHYSFSFFVFHLIIIFYFNFITNIGNVSFIFYLKITTFDPLTIFSKVPFLNASRYIF